MTQRVKKMVTMAMLAAMSYIVMLVVHIKVFDFLTVDFKDVIISIGGFIYGPLAAGTIALVVSFVEMFTVSTTGIIGFAMNVLSSCAFSCTAAFIYKRNASIKNAVIGLLVGCLAMTAVMLLWNYLITPLYMNAPREKVAGMLVPIFLPFNLLKGSLNAAVTMLVYKPLVTGLRKTKLVPSKENSSKGRFYWSVTLLSLLVLVCLVVIVFIFVK